MMLAIWIMHLFPVSMGTEIAMANTKVFVPDFNVNRNSNGT